MLEDKIRILISQYLDGQLDEAQKAEVEKLIADSPEYAEYYRRLKELEEQVDSFDPGGDEAYWEKQKDSVLDKISETESEKVIDIRPESRGLWYKLLAVAASIALVAFVSIYESQEELTIKGPFDKPQAVRISKDSLPAPTAQPVSGREQLETLDSKKKGTPPEALTKAPSEKKAAVSEEAEWDDDILPEEGSRMAFESAGEAVPEPVDEIQLHELEREKKGPAKAEPDGSLEDMDAVGGDANEIKIVVEAERNVISSYAPSTMPIQSIDINLAEGSSVQRDVLESEPSKDKGVLGIQSEGRGATARTAGKMTASLSETVDIEDKKDDYYHHGTQSDTTRAVYWRGVIDSLNSIHGNVISPHYRESALKARKLLTEEEINNVLMLYARAYFQVGAYSFSSDSGAVYGKKLQSLLPLVDSSGRADIELYIERLRSFYK